MFDDLHELEPGDRIAHDQWNMLVQFVKRTFAADHYFEDESGLVIFDQGGDATEVIAFTLTEDMDATTDGEASVTIHGTWDADTEAYKGSDPGVVLSIGEAFDDALSGA